ncbi:hypothetical protein [Streptomyces sp. MUM 178J]|uniref:hypothetical protein n=1 Tax=Streptomyces sp. MUM 178J TaxID=2791991 RepID=UPI001F0470E2|nr:hypothetical protein [Streptomyces sp. MUM 178J]WRQ78075.1 hypothetical protein I3F59_001015 [Streptomyces sp. MUM 178J]
MTDIPLSAGEAARWARRAGLPLDTEHAPAVAARADRVHALLSPLRTLEFGETPPAAAYDALKEPGHAAGRAE